MESIISFLIGLLIVYIVGKILLIPIKIVGKLLLNSITGGIVIFLLNTLASPLGLYIDMTPLNAIIVGIFGNLGVVLLLLF